MTRILLKWCWGCWNVVKIQRKIRCVDAVREYWAALAKFVKPALEMVKSCPKRHKMRGLDTNIHKLSLKRLGRRKIAVNGWCNSNASTDVRNEDREICKLAFIVDKPMKYKVQWRWSHSSMPDPSLMTKNMFKKRYKQNFFNDNKQYQY